MKPPVLVSGGVIVVCLVTLWGAWDTHWQLANLRAEQQRLLADRTAAAETAANPPEAAPAPAAASPELLRLRSEVTRLTERRRELASVTTEHQRLQAQLASRATNGGLRLSPGYIRQADARLVGYNTPEDTLQSFLWALHNHDFTNFLRALAPEAIQGVQDGRRPEILFRDTDQLIGMGILQKEVQDDGTVEAEVEMVPGLPHARIRLRQLAGEWKIAAPF